ncbi:MAG: hypothetical protein ACP6IQ_02355 [Candidatus Njordarchaeia archaeon]
MSDYKKTFITAKLSADNFYNAKASSNESYEKLGVNIDSVDLPDLLYVKFVMASEHENDNGDYFLRSELIKSYKTARHKPYNIEHKVEEKGSYLTQALFNETKNTIIGHIVGSSLAYKDGTILSEEEIEKLDKTDDPNRPEEESLDLLASAVLYKFLFPATVKDLKDMASTGSLSVSMEVWFKGFDFMVGGSIISPGNEEEFKSYVTQWKENKAVNGRRVSRVLKDILWGGVAATETPANKYSKFITASLQHQLNKINKRHEELHILYKYNPTKEIEEEHRVLTQTAAKIKKQLENAGS